MDVHSPRGALAERAGVRRRRFDRARRRAAHAVASPRARGAHPPSHRMGGSARSGNAREHRRLPVPLAVGVAARRPRARRRADRALDRRAARSSVDHGSARRCRVAQRRAHDHPGRGRAVGARRPDQGGRERAPGVRLARAGRHGSLAGAARARGRARVALRRARRPTADRAFMRCRAYAGSPRPRSASVSSNSERRGSSACSLRPEAASVSASCSSQRMDPRSRSRMLPNDRPRRDAYTLPR